MQVEGAACRDPVKKYTRNREGFQRPASILLCLLVCCTVRFATCAGLGAPTPLPFELSAFAPAVPAAGNLTAPAETSGTAIGGAGLQDFDTSRLLSTNFSLAELGLEWPDCSVAASTTPANFTSLPTVVNQAIYTLPAPAAAFIRTGCLVWQNEDELSLTAMWTAATQLGDETSMYSSSGFQLLPNVIFQSVSSESESFFSLVADGEEILLARDSVNASGANGTLDFTPAPSPTLASAGGRRLQDLQLGSYIYEQQLSEKSSSRALLQQEGPGDGSCPIELTLTLSKCKDGKPISNAASQPSDWKFIPILPSGRMSWDQPVGSDPTSLAAQFPDHETVGTWTPSGNGKYGITLEFCNGYRAKQDQCIALLNKWLYFCEARKDELFLSLDKELALKQEFEQNVGKIVEGFLDVLTVGTAEVMSLSDIVGLSIGKSGLKAFIGSASAVAYIDQKLIFARVCSCSQHRNNPYNEGCCKIEFPKDIKNAVQYEFTLTVAAPGFKPKVLSNGLAKSVLQRAPHTFDACLECDDSRDSNGCYKCCPLPALVWACAALGYDC